MRKMFFPALAALAFGFFVIMQEKISQDFPNITIQHAHGGKTELRCKTGSGVLTCKPQDMVLTH